MRRVQIRPGFRHAPLRRDLSGAAVALALAASIAVVVMTMAGAFS